MTHRPRRLGRAVTPWLLYAADGSNAVEVVIRIAAVTTRKERRHRPREDYLTPDGWREVWENATPRRINQGPILTWSCEFHITSENAHRDADRLMHRYGDIGFALTPLTKVGMCLGAVFSVSDGRYLHLALPSSDGDDECVPPQWVMDSGETVNNMSVDVRVVRGSNREWNKIVL